MSFAVPPSSSWQPTLSAYAASLHSAEAPFRSAATHPPAARVFARLRVAAGCGLMLFISLRQVGKPCVVRSGLITVFAASTQANPAKQKTAPALHFYIAANRPRSSGFLFAPPLLHSQDGSRKLGQCPQPVPLKLHSLQPLSSRLAQGCFSCVYAHPDALDPTRS